MKQGKRILAFLLALLLVFCTACGKNKEAAAGEENKPSDSKQETQKQEQTEAKPTFGYKPTYLSVDFGDSQVQYVNNNCVSGDHMFLVAGCQTGMEIYTNEVTGEPYLDENGQPIEIPVQEQRLFRVELATGAVTALPVTLLPVEEGMLGDAYIGTISSDGQGGFWIAEECYRYHFDLPETFDPEIEDAYMYYVDDGHTVTCRHFDSEGNELASLPMEAPDGAYLSMFEFMADGTIYATDWMNIYHYDETGALKGSVVLETGFNNMIRMGENQIGVSVWEEEGQFLVPIDPETLTMGVGEKLPSNVYQMMAGFGEYRFTYMNNDVIYGLKDGVETGEKVLSWLECDVDSSYINGFTFLPDGTVYGMENLYDSESGASTYRLVRMDRVDASQIPQRVELSLACFGLDWDVRTEVLEFNRAQEQVRIVVKDYSQYATDEDYYAGMTKLNTEVLSGNVPDLFLMQQNFPVKTYAAKGILQDLWPLIDADAELSRDDLMTHFFDVISVDGKLYQITPSFAIDTVVGRSDVIGNAESWTLENMMTIHGDYPGSTIFGETDTREGMIHNILLNNVERFVDWNNKQCSFNTGTFEGLLELAKTFPEEFSYEDFDWELYGTEGMRMRMRRQLLCQAYISGFDMLQYYNAMCEGKANFIGFPTVDGTGSSFSFYNSLAISSTCKDVDSAWKFVRNFLTEEHQTQEYMYQFPTNKHSFDAFVEQMTTPQWFETDPETGEEVESPRNWYWFGDEEEVPIYSMTQEEYDLFMNLYEKTNTTGGQNDAIAEIILEEAEAFFAGEKSAKDTAALIQDRVSLYVFEQG